MTRYLRREFLRKSVGASTLVSLGDLGALAQFNAAAAQPLAADVPQRIDPEIERLYRVIHETRQDELIPAIFRELRNGMTHRQFLSALFVQAMRHNGHHRVFSHHSVNQLSLDVGREERILPLLWHADQSKWRHIQGLNQGPLKNERLPSLRNAAEAFDRAQREGDRETAQAAIVALSRGEGPRQAYSRLWRHIAAGGPHHSVSTANCFRSLDAIGWQYGEALLQWKYVQGTVSWDAHNRQNEELCRRMADRLPVDWAALRSDSGAVRELYSVLREGNRTNSCHTVCNMLVDGRVQAGTVWDAVFLNANYRNGHSHTGANGQHYAFCTTADRQIRLNILLHAVSQVTVGPRGTLKPPPEIELPGTVEETVEEIFALIPPRRAFHSYGYPGQQRLQRAQQLTFAMSLRYSDVSLFFRTARRLLCLKSTIDTHDIKFPVAAFESWQHVSPQWRPYLLAASVNFLHGTEMEDSPFIEQAREELANL